MLMPCTICKQLILLHTPASATECGHLFHECCVNKWFEDKTSCPQCRVNLLQKPFRIKFNVIEEEEDDDESRFEHLMQTYQSHKAEADSLRKRNAEIESYVSNMHQTSLDLDNKLKLSKLEISALRKEYRQAKMKVERARKLKEENEQLEHKLKLLTKIDKIINGHDCEMYEILERIPVTQMTVQELCIIILAMKNKIKMINECSEMKKYQANSLMEKVDRELMSLKETKEKILVSDKSIQTTECLEE